MAQVSIVIPCYNCEKYLAKCLDSVLAQTCQDWDAVVVDDGSSDASAAVLAQYATRDSRFRVVRQENRGLSAVRNRALGMVTGEYISFLDADDFYDAEFLADLLAEARRTGADVVMTNTRFVDGGETWQTHFERKVLANLSEKIEVLPHGSVCDKMFRADFIRANGFLFPEGLYYEDVPFLVKALFRANRLAVVDGAAYNYVMNASSILHDPQKECKRVKDGVTVAEMVMDFAAASQMDERIREILTDFLLRNILNLKKVGEEDFQSVRRFLSPTPYLLRQVRRCERRARRRRILAFFGQLLPFRTKHGTQRVLQLPLASV